MLFLFCLQVILSYLKSSEIVKNDLGQIDNSEIELLKKYSESTNAIGSSEEVFI